MNRRYILLDSTYRNRSDDSNPYSFTAHYKTYGNQRSRATDGISDNAAIVQYDMGDYFLDTDSDFTAPYRWRQTGAVVSLVGSSPTNRFVVTINARKNGGSAPAPVTGQYVGLDFVHSSTETSTITRFTDLNNGSSQYEIELADSITVAPLDTFEIFTSFLELNQSYIPTPVDIIDLENAYTSYQLVEIEDGLYGTITSFDATTRILTNETDFDLSAAPTFPDKFFITKSARLVSYQIDGLVAATRTIEVTIADNPNLTPSALLYNYIYHYPSGTTARIISVTEPEPPTGQMFITVSGDISALSITDDIYILLYVRDNNYPLTYNGPMIGTQYEDRGQVRIYDLELVWLSIPDKILKNHPGGTPINYPYLYVDLENLSSESRTDQIIFANSPNVDKATFVPTIFNDTTSGSSFIKLKGDGMVYPFNIKSKDTLRFTIRSPAGEVLELSQLDTQSPHTPDPFIQVSALFAVTSRPTSTPCYTCNPTGLGNIRPTYM